MAGPAQSRLLVATAAPPTRHQRHTLGSSSLLLLVAYWLRLRLLPPTPSPARSSRLFFHQVPSCFALPFFCCYPFVLSFFFTYQVDLNSDLLSLSRRFLPRIPFFFGYRVFSLLNVCRVFVVFMIILFCAFLRQPFFSRYPTPLSILTRLKKLFFYTHSFVFVTTKCGVRKPQQVPFSVPFLAFSKRKRVFFFERIGVFVFLGQTIPSTMRSVNLVFLPSPCPIFIF